MNIDKKYFIDNDVIIKLSCFDLLDELIVSLESSYSFLYVLPTFQYVAKLHSKEKRLKIFKDDSSAEKAMHFFSNCMRAELNDLETFQLISAIPNAGIDPGELLLLACVYAEPNGYLMSGDKRAIRQFFELQSQGAIPYIGKRFITLEVAILLILDTFGYSHVASKVCLRPDVDKALTICFGNKTPNPEEFVKSGLASYIHDLKKQVGDIVHTG